LAGTAGIDALEQALAPTIGSLPARLFATELSVIGYALTKWRSPTPAEDAGTFSMHRRSHYGVVIGVFLFLLGSEAVATHVVVAHWSRGAAWLLSASSVWAALWLIGDAHALRLQPLRVTAEGLAVRVGIRWRTFVPHEALLDICLADGATK